MKFWWFMETLRATVIIALTVVFSYLIANVVGQEHPPRATRQWELGRVKYNNWTELRVDVFDTEGVCLYVAVRSGKNTAIAAVPKTQLPHGAGCQ